MTLIASGAETLPSMIPTPRSCVAASRRPRGSQPVADPVRSNTSVLCAERWSICRTRRLSPVARTNVETTLISKPPTGMRHTGRTGQRNPVPTCAGERRALAKAAAARRILAEWSYGEVDAGGPIGKAASTSRSQRRQRGRR